MSIGAFSLDQLMELAGLSVSQAGTMNAPLYVPAHPPYSPFKSHVDIIPQ